MAAFQRGPAYWLPEGQLTEISSVGHETSAIVRERSPQPVTALPVVVLERLPEDLVADMMVRISAATEQIPARVPGGSNTVGNEQPAVNTVRQPGRRRHAVVPHRVTYKTAYLANVDIDAVQLNYLGPMDASCRRCNAVFFRTEGANRQGERVGCCKMGEVVLPQLRECPDILKGYLTGRDHLSVEFRRNIRSINSLFAMASFKTSMPDATEVEGQGHWSFAVCGQIYHYTEALPDTQQRQRPVLNQYYFVDAAEAVDRRAEFLVGRVDRRIIEDVEGILRRVNPLIGAYQTMNEVIEERISEGESVNNIVLAFKENIQGHLRTHGLPESRSDIAAVFCGEDPPFDVDLAVYPRNREACRELKNLNVLADPMVYPLLFPGGDLGYDMHRRYVNRPAKAVTLREHYRYRLQIRAGFSSLHHGGKLFQQFVVDAWCKIEANELWWLRQHQQSSRMAIRQAIVTMLNERAARENMRVGNIVVLPPQHAGGPRSKVKKYLAAMDIVSKLGKPDMFITFTCNPHWAEITENLHPPQEWQHRPDLVARVFHLKLTEFLDDLKNKQVYGVVLYMMHVIEFQKRGLPHAHILVAFRPEDKPDCVELIDGLVCATIPDAEREPRLHSVVKECYVHRPCGAENPGAPCMRDGRCTKYYPKRFCQSTTMGVGRNGQPEYKRPNDGRTLMIDGVLVDNRRIVPYNKYAAAKFGCHINFEIAGDLTTIRYVFKYVHKGPDHATVEMVSEGRTLHWDEIRSFLDCRYVSSSEAAWKIFSFHMDECTHSVMPLPVHLPGEQMILFDDEDTAEEIAANLNKRTKLEAYFLLNATDAEARRLKYSDVPEHYTWDYRPAEWKRRQQVSKMFGSIVEVSPREQEKFYLRMLLSNVRGATSFEDLRTVRGVRHDDFKGACMALGLLSNTDEYDRCLTEASLNRSPYGIRKLFALMLTTAVAEIAHQIPALWTKHRPGMIMDFIENGLPETLAEAKALKHIADVLRRNGDHTLADFGLPSVNEELLLITPPQDYEQIEVHENFPGDAAMLNVGQRAIYEKVMTAVERGSVSDENGAIFYIDACGGTGKTFLFNTLIKEVHRRFGRVAIAVAWTGIAASLLIAGKTAHRTFKLPLNVTPGSRAGYPYESPESAVIRDATIIIWDEASMANRLAVELVDRYLRDITGVAGTPMGGKVVVFGGDFRQTLPVVPRGHRTEVINATLMASYLWTAMQHLQLHENVRAGAAQIAYAEWLLLLGEGRLPHVRMNTSDPAVPLDLIELPAVSLAQTREQLFDYVFGSDYSGDMSGRAILCPTNVSVNQINRQILEKLPGEMRTYFSVDEYLNEDNDDLYVPIDYVNSVTVASLPPHELCLKAGAVVMLLRNLDIDMGLCNGSRLKVVSLGDCVIEVELLTGTHKGDKLLLPKIKMQASDTALPKPLTRFQFPVTLAFAMTINKSQGQTFQKVGLYLEKPCFAHGQLYVAFSRVGSLENVKVYVEDSGRQGSFKYRNKKFTRNVVYETIVCGDPATVRTSEVVDPANLETVRGDLDFTQDEQQQGWSAVDVERMIEEIRQATEVISMSDDERQSPVVVDPAERLLIPDFNTQQLQDRVAEGDRPGTTGAFLHRPPVIERYDSDSSSE